MKVRKRERKYTEPLPWLPVDSRLILPILSFGRVRGVAKVFLTIEMVLAFATVSGTFAIIVLHYFF